ncbi:MAG TPA: helix-turn-helix domain-containing protein [Salinivirgaceae bacterium]|nr:helix-turn-helix domain-containing protein [Salinivirgaceae bacterium]
MSEQLLLVTILKDYFLNSNEPLAVDIRKYLAGTDSPIPTEKPNVNAELSDWLDGQDVMQALHISPRTLQNWRTNGTLPYSRIGNKIYYRRQDIIKILNDNYIMFKHQNRNKGNDK